MSLFQKNWESFLSVLPEDVPPELMVSFDQLQSLGRPPPKFREFETTIELSDRPSTLSNRTTIELSDGPSMLSRRLARGYKVTSSRVLDLKEEGPEGQISAGYTLPSPGKEDHTAFRNFPREEVSRAWKWLITRIVEANGYDKAEEVQRCPKCSIWLVPGQPHSFCPVAIQEQREQERDAP